jgi:hypothetical protein
MEVCFMAVISYLNFENGLKDQCNPGTNWETKDLAVIKDSNKKNGSKSLYIPGGTSYICAPFNISSDFTVDFFLYVNSSSEGGVIYFSDDPLISNSTVVYIDGHRSGCGIYDGFNIGYASGTKTVPRNTWIHFAFVKKDSTYTLFVDGGVAWSGQIPTVPVKYISIGGFHTTPKGYYNSFDGYIDELRISDVALWTSDFTPSGTSDRPTNLTATAGDAKVTLLWDAVSGATGYIVKRSTTAGGPYITIATNVTGTSYVDTTVTNGTTYYYVITAVDGNGNESGNSNEASAAPQASSGHGLLRITMNDSSEREYRLSTGEIESFIKWYDRTVGTGNTCYAFDDIVDLSKEYLSFEKIICFKVIPLKD